MLIPYVINTIREYYYSLFDSYLVWPRISVEMSSPAGWKEERWDKGGGEVGEGRRGGRREEER